MAARTDAIVRVVERKSYFIQSLLSEGVEGYLILRQFLHHVTDVASDILNTDARTLQL